MVNAKYEKDVVKRVNIYDENDIQGITIIPKSIMRKIIFIAGAVLTSIPIYEIFFGSLSPDYQRPIFLMLMYIITLSLFPSNYFKKRPVIESVFNIILVLLWIVIMVWAHLRWIPMYLNPHAEFYDKILGTIAILIVFENCRRAIGIPMAIIATVFLGYCFVGPYMPIALAHPGFTISDVIVHCVVGASGMLGTTTGIGATQIIFFMMFAAFLRMTNSTNSFMDFSQSIAGSLTGGPAKVAVVSSAMMGMVSGSSTGNTAATGAITIPLMIKLGFKKHVAAAVEATASAAGQIMPPIMGATAFIIAEYTGRSYWDVCLAALIPSFLWFAGMFFVIDTQSRKNNLHGLDKAELPPLGESFVKILPLLIPLTVLVIALSMRFSAQYSIMVTILVLIIICLPLKEQRIGPKKILQALALTAKIMIPIGASVATAGLIIGVMSLTGFGDKLAYAILAVAKGNMFIALLFTALMCIIIGMGLPTMSSYIVLAAMGAPALVQLGVPLMAAHMFIFYCAIISTITPPVCMAAYVGAGIAGANPMKVGFTAVLMAPFIYIIPFMFVYNNGLLMQTGFAQVIIDLLEMVLIMFPVILLSRLYWYRKINAVEIVVFVTSIILIFYLPENRLFIPLILELIGAMYHLIRSKVIKIKT